jgi:ubiquinone/menaquinone biosynthesis C-methylase UbiE
MTDIAFEVMSLDALTLPGKSVDAAISQFGFLQEGDVGASVRELSRVLKDGAPYSAASPLTCDNAISADIACQAVGSADY